MKAQTTLLLSAALALILAPTALAGTNAPKTENLPAIASQTMTPEFDRFLVRLQTCKGIIPALAQWQKVLKPTLRDLGYDEDQLKQIKTALCKNAATLADARFFSERWQARHREQVSPKDIFEFLHRTKAAPENLELAVK